MNGTSRINEQSQLLAAEPVRYDSLGQPPLHRQPSHITKTTRARNRWIAFGIGSLLVVLITAFIGVNVFWVSQRTDELIGKSVEMEVHNISLAGVSTKGVDVHINGATLVDYDGIESDYFKKLMKLGGGVLRSADLKLDAVDLEVVIDEEKVRLGTVDIPDMNVKVGHGQSTPMDMVVRIHPETSKLLGLVKKLVTHPEEILKVYGSTALKISLAGIPIGKFKINFEQAILPINYFDLTPEDVAITNASITPTEDSQGYDISFLITIPNPVKEKLISLQVPQLHWNAFINDCVGDPTIALFDGTEVITSSAFEVSALTETLSVQITNSVSQINDQLNSLCGDEESTPLDGLIRGVMNNNTLAVRIQNIGGSKEYPKFLNELLMNNAMDFNFHPNSGDSNTSHLIHNTSLDNLGFEFLDGDLGSPSISGEVNVFIEIPISGIEDGLGVKLAKGVPTLYHNGVMFGEVELNEWHSCVNEYVWEDGVEYLHVKIELDQESVIITDSGVFAGVVNEVLLCGGSKILIKSDLDCVVETLIGNLQVNGIHVENESEINMGSLFSAKDDSLVNKVKMMLKTSS